MLRGLILTEQVPNGNGREATRVSFQVASGLGEMMLGAAPPTSAIEEWVLDMARPAYLYMSEGPLPEDDRDVPVIEVDGKAVPTATDQEMARRRQPRAANGIVNIAVLGQT